MDHCEKQPALTDRNFCKEQQGDQKSCNRDIHKHPAFNGTKFIISGQLKNGIKGKKEYPYDSSEYMFEYADAFSQNR